MKRIFTSILFVVFHLSLIAQVPSNNDCANAISLVELNNYCSQQLFGEATFDITDGPCAPAFNPALNIWYKFTAVGSRVTIGATAGSNIYKISIVKFPFGPCDNAEIVACDLASLTTNTLSIGDEYYIIISSGNSSEEFELCIDNPLPAPPPNNDPCNAVVLKDWESSCGNTVDATVTLPVLSLPCPNIANNQIWYQVNIPSGRPNLRISLSTSSLSGGVQLILGRWSDGCGGTFQYLESHAYCGPASTPFEFNCLQPDKYYILISSGNEEAGEFCFSTINYANQTQCSQNDECINAKEVPQMVLNDSPTWLNGNCNISACAEDIVSPGCNYNGGVVWFKVTTPAGSNKLNITLISQDGSLSNPQIQLFEGDCNSLSAITGCQIGANGSMILKGLAIAENTTYYVAVGNHSGTTGNFDISFSSNDPTPACLLESQMVPLSTSKGSPLEGPYQPGESVTFSYTFTFSSLDNGCQWPHGVVPVFGPCWDLSASDFESSGSWGWFNEGEVTYKGNNPFILSSTGDDAFQRLCYYTDPNCSGEPLTAGTSLPAGWFYTNGGGPCSNQVDPNNSWGYHCNGCGNTCDIVFNLTLVAKSFEDCEMDTALTDCNVQVFVFSDRQTGCWLGAPDDNTCISDFPAYFNSSLNCCEGIDFQMDKTIFCYNEGPILLEASPPDGEWLSLNPAILIENNILDPKQLNEAGIYEFLYSSSNIDCHSSDILRVEVIFSAKDCPDTSVETHTDGTEAPFTGTINTLPILTDLPKDTEVRIFDTLGKELYFSRNYQNDWNPDNYPAGLYFFIVTIEGKNYQQVISLIK